jgi:hypothetical protein
MQMGWRTDDRCRGRLDHRIVQAGKPPHAVSFGNCLPQLALDLDK